MLTTTLSGTHRVVLPGVLDADAAAELRDDYRQVLACGGRRLEVDLSPVQTATEEGVAAVAWCLVAGRHLPDGVGVTVATAAGRAALLGSMAQL